MKMTNASVHMKEFSLIAFFTLGLMHWSEVGNRARWSAMKWTKTTEFEWKSSLRNCYDRVLSENYNLKEVWWLGVLII